MTQAVATQTQVLSNQFSVTGRVGAEPKVLHFQSGNSLSEIPIYCDEPGRTSPYYTVVLWNKVGEVAAKYLKKGDKITVRGEFKFDTWNDKVTGEPRRKLKLSVNDRFGLDLPSKSSANAIPTTAPAPAQTVEVPAAEVSDEEWDEIAF